MKDIKNNFINWLIAQGLSEKTPTGRPSTVYEYQKRIDRLCDKLYDWHSSYEWKKFAEKIYPILAIYLIIGNKNEPDINEIYDRLQKHDLLNDLERLFKNKGELDTFLYWLLSNLKDSRKTRSVLTRFYKFLRENERDYKYELNFDEIDSKLSDIAAEVSENLYIGSEQATETKSKKIIRRYPDSEDESLAHKEVSDLLEISEKATKHLRDKGDLKYKGYAGRYSLNDIQKYLDDHIHFSGHIYPEGSYTKNDIKKWLNAAQASKELGWSKSKLNREKNRFTHTNYAPNSNKYFPPDVKRIAVEDGKNA